MVATEENTASKRYWGMRVGEGGKYVHLALEGGYIALHWKELPDLSEWASRAHEPTLWGEFKDFYKERSPSESPTQVAISAGQVRNFALEMSPGDWVLVPGPKRQVHIAEVRTG